ncbi:hypothetical protein ACH4OW_28295 [Streptomyces sp. NPDC017056]|uniref:hypothetical protein n=1 Tax=Streptomyces sp. NPDC017056 TaxID=3364973 RepID=UPI0037B4B6C4
MTQPTPDEARQALLAGDCCGDDTLKGGVYGPCDCPESDRLREIGGMTWDDKPVK